MRPVIANLAVAARVAARELRGGLRGFRVFLASLTLGVFAIAAVGSLSAMVMAGIAENARALLGGDVEISQSGRAIDDRVIAHLQRTSERMTISHEMRAMARAVAADGPRTLVELKAVDDAYPLYGMVRLSTGEDLATALAPRNGRFGAVAEDTLLIKLAAGVGDTLRVGEIEVEVRAVLVEEPDRVANAFSLGPRLMVNDAALAAADLLQEGNLARYRYRARLAEDQPYDAWERALRAAFPEALWRLRNAREAQPSIRRFVERLTVFLTLAGVTALVVGGIGVGNAVQSYLGGKTATIATLKCLGARSDLIFGIYLLQVLALALVGVVGGTVLGALAPHAGLYVFGSSLPLPVEGAFFLRPLVLAAAFGLLTAFAFALWPLARARDIPAAGLFRDLVAPERQWPRWPFVALCVGAFAALAALAVFGVGQSFIAGWFVVGAFGMLVVFRLLASAVLWGVGRLPRATHPTLRLALANLVRPGAATAGVIVSLGVGITVLVATALVQGNLDRQVDERIPDRAPAFFFLDVQPDQVPAFEAALRALPGFHSFERAPNLRGRLVAIKGTPVTEAEIAPPQRWVRSGEVAATYSAPLPRRAAVSQGNWWPIDYRGEPIVSLDEVFAQGLGVGIGDTLTFNILGRDVTARVHNLRRVDWSDFGINFVIVFGPGTLEAAPQTHIATAAIERDQEADSYRRITQAFTNISVVRVRDVIEAATRVLDRIAAAAAGSAAVTILAGILVLAGAIAAGHRRRVYEAVVLKVVGATRGNILAAYLAEFAILGIITGTLAVAIGGLGAYLVITQVMEAEWRFLPGAAALTAALGVAVTLVFGCAGTWLALRQRPAPVLRHS
jgi:putative ABC transport system permease protein